MVNSNSQHGFGNTEHLQDELVMPNDMDYYKQNDSPQETESNKPLSYDDARTERDEQDQQLKRTGSEKARERLRGWEKNFDLSERGVIKDTYHNLKLIFKNDTDVKKLFAYESFEHVIGLNYKPKWAVAKNAILEDYDVVAIKIHVETQYGIRATKQRIEEAIQREARDYAHHIIKQKIEVAKWDGVQRAESVFIDFLGVEDTEYNRAVTRVTLTGAIARIYLPGVKFDTMLIIMGGQGIGKSYLFSRLAMSHFTDALPSMDLKKDNQQILLGSWFVEDSELTALNDSGVNQAKRFIASTSDKFRMAFDKHFKDYARQCIFVGTTNNRVYLKDDTGNRRFLPMFTNKTKKDKPEISDEYIQQIWAEVLTWWLDDSKTEKEKLVLSDDMEKVAESMATEVAEENPYQTEVDSYIEKLITPDYYSLSTLSKREEWINAPSIHDDNIGLGYKKKEIVSAYEIYHVVYGNNLKPTKHNSGDKEIKEIRHAIMNSKYFDKSLGAKRLGNDELLQSHVAYKVNL